MRRSKEVALSPIAPDLALQQSRRRVERRPSRRLHACHCHSNGRRGQFSRDRRCAAFDPLSRSQRRCAPRPDRSLALADWLRTGLDSRRNESPSPRSQRLSALASPSFHPRCPLVGLSMGQRKSRPASTQRFGSRGRRDDPPAHRQGVHGPATGVEWCVLKASPISCDRARSLDRCLARLFLC